MTKRNLFQECKVGLTFKHRSTYFTILINWKNCLMISVDTGVPDKIQLHSRLDAGGKPPRSVDAPEGAMLTALLLNQEQDKATAFTASAHHCARRLRVHSGKKKKSNAPRLGRKNKTCLIYRQHISYAESLTDST